MKQFSCKEVNSNCNAVLVAPTEERLIDMVSVHLRDVHGMTALMPEQMAQIKNLFTTPASPDAAYVVDRIFEKYNCDSDPECTWRYISEAEMILTGRPQPHEKEFKAA